MRILFIHKHYPGPFGALALAFGSVPGNTVLFLAERGNRTLRLPGVRRLRVAPPVPYDSRDEAEKEAVIGQRQAARMANSLLRLKNDGFIPDVILCASNEGYSLYIRDVFPEAAVIARAEWFFTKGESHTFFTRGKSRPAADFAPARIRNMFQYNNMAEAHAAVAATAWLKSQYPTFFQPKIAVIHDGIDAGYFTPAPGTRFVTKELDLGHVSELVSFSSRRDGPSRGFPQFWRSLPALLEQRPDCHILVMRPENPDNSGPDQAEEALLPPSALKRVHVLPFSPEAYPLLLQASDVHVYLTAPYTFSSGLLEAMSTGALVVGSDTPPGSRSCASRR